MAPSDRIPVEDALGEYWNGVVAERPISPTIDLDPSLIAAIERVRLLDDARSPDGDFVEALQRTLLDGGVAALADPADFVMPTGHGPNGHERPHPLARTSSPSPVEPEEGSVAVADRAFWGRGAPAPPSPGPTDRVPTPSVAVRGMRKRFAGHEAPLDPSLPLSTSALGEGERRRRDSGMSFPALLATAALVLLTLGLAVAGGLLHRRAEERSWAPPVLPAIQDGPVEFVWESVGLPNLLATRSSTDVLPMSSPYHLAIDPQGNIWIPDALSNQIRVLAPDGSLIRVWGSKGREEGEFNLAHGQTFGWYGSGAVAFDAVGNLYVADPGNFRIQKFAPDLRFLTAWGSKGESNGQFLGLKDLAIDAEGRIYALDTIRHDIQVFDADGEFLTSWGSRGIREGEFLSPYGIAADSEGNVVVADTGNNRLQKFTSDGVFQAMWGSMGTKPAQFREPDDVAIDSEGRIFVADSANNRVQMLDAEGRFLAQWGKQGEGSGQFRVPVGIALDQAGNVYVTESVSGRVQKFRLPPLGT